MWTWLKWELMLLIIFHVMPPICHLMVGESQQTHVLTAERVSTAANFLMVNLKNKRDFYCNFLISDFFIVLERSQRKMFWNENACKLQGWHQMKSLVEKHETMLECHETFLHEVGNTITDCWLLKSGHSVEMVIYSRRDVNFKMSEFLK